MKRWWLATVACGGVMSLAVQAADVPELRKGIWQLKKLINKRPYETQQCMEPFVDLLRQHAEQQSSGCDHNVKRLAEDRWEITSRCRKVNEQGRHWESDAVTTFVVNSDTSYRMTVTGATHRAPHQESIEARWMSPCRN